MFIKRYNFEEWILLRNIAPRMPDACADIRTVQFAIIEKGLNMKARFIKCLSFCITVTISAHVYGVHNSVGMSASWVNCLRNSPVSSTMNKWKLPGLIGLTAVAGWWAFKNKELINEDYRNFLDYYIGKKIDIVASQSSFKEGDIVMNPIGNRFFWEVGVVEGRSTDVRSSYHHFKLIPWLQFCARTRCENIQVKLCVTGSVKSLDSNKLYCLQTKNTKYQSLLKKQVQHQYFGKGEIIGFFGAGGLSMTFFAIQFHNDTIRAIFDSAINQDDQTLIDENRAYQCFMDDRNKGVCRIMGTVDGEIYPCYHPAHCDRQYDGWEKVSYRGIPKDCPFLDDYYGERDGCFYTFQKVNPTS